MTALDFLGRSFVGFQEHASPDDRAFDCRWVDLKSFRFPAGSPDRDLLAALVAHEQFRDDYAGGGVDPAGIRHGCYWLDRITPAAYRPVTHGAADQVLREWADQYGRLTQSLEAALDASPRAVLGSADRLYLLPELGSDTWHDWGRVHEDFHEFVAVDDDRRVLTLLVAADD
ncbi:hypothetical protein [Kitasatospora sp. NPDC057198]|uniref:hypothetical protein n=1 Tax=Kitasatospora sp. NPDC057198 TaxID=3346046 RepID=UPI00362B583C